MKIIVGLGNPGSKYVGTRHNVGFDVLRQLAERHTADTPRAKFESMVAECQIGTVRTLLVWPQTYMNLSGQAAQLASAFYKTPLEDLLVVCDDFHLPLGTQRLKPKGSAGGQNGLKDVIQRLGSDEVPRLRVGVGPVPEGWETVGFVLGKFAKEDAAEAEQAIKTCAEAAGRWATEGITAAMNKYN